jgi:hypothetical protein
VLFMQERMEHLEREEEEEERRKDQKARMNQQKLRQDMDKLPSPFPFKGTMPRDFRIQVFSTKSLSISKGPL